MQSNSDISVYCLSHSGVKGMKWGVRKSVKKFSANVHRRSRAIGAAYIESQTRGVERAIAQNKVRNKDNKAVRQRNNARYKAKLKRLNSTYNSRISDLSEADIQRGRDAYKTIRNVGVSVAVTAAAATIGSVSASAGFAVKLAGAGLTSALTKTDDD